MGRICACEKTSLEGLPAGAGPIPGFKIETGGTPGFAYKCGHAQKKQKEHLAQEPAVSDCQMGCHPERSEGSAVVFGHFRWNYFRVGHNSPGTPTSLKKFV